MKHGANIYKYASKLSCKADDIYDFSSNINHYHPKISITPTNNMLVKYADSSYLNLKKTISKKYDIKKNQISLYNGATSAIFALFDSLKGGKVYLYAPLYGEYEKALGKNQKIVKINRFKNLYKKVEKGSVVVFVNPSTPDGNHYDLEVLFKMWKKQNCIVILDESFIEFEGLKSWRNEINSYEKLYIIQSFSKFYSCAGVRIGAVFSNKKNINKLKTPLWNLSSFDVKFLTLRLKDKSFEKKSKNLHLKRKNELFRVLKSSKIFDKIYKSDTNFFLTKAKETNKIFNHLLKNKILTRKCGSFDFLNDNYLRFGIKNKKMHKLLKKALDELT